MDTTTSLILLLYLYATLSVVGSAAAMCQDLTCNELACNVGSLSTGEKDNRVISGSTEGEPRYEFCTTARGLQVCR